MSSKIFIQIHKEIDLLYDDMSENIDEIMCLVQTINLLYFATIFKENSNDSKMHNYFTSNTPQSKDLVDKIGEERSVAALLGAHGSPTRY